MRWEEGGWARRGGDGTREGGEGALLDLGDQQRQASAGGTAPKRGRTGAGSARSSRRRSSLGDRSTRERRLLEEDGRIDEVTEGRRRGRPSAARTLERGRAERRRQLVSGRGSRALGRQRATRARVLQTQRATGSRQSRNSTSLAVYCPHCSPRSHHRGLCWCCSPSYSCLLRRPASLAAADGARPVLDVAHSWQTSCSHVCLAAASPSLRRLAGSCSSSSV